MRSVFLGNPLLARPIQLYREQIPLSLVAFVGRVEDGTARLVNFINPDNFKIAPRQLLLKLCCRTRRISFAEAVEIKVGEAIAPALPEKLVAGLQHAERVVPHDPGIIFF